MHVIIVKIYIIHLVSASCILLLRKASDMAEIFSFVFISSLYVLATLTRGPDDALVSLR